MTNNRQPEKTSYILTQMLEAHIGMHLLFRHAHQGLPQLMAFIYIKIL